MSHIVSIKTVLKDLEAVELVCKELGLQFKRGQTTYKWWGRYMGDSPLPHGFKPDDLGKCEHAIGVPGTEWEIGVVPLKDGSGYTLLFDYFAGSGRPILERLADPVKFAQLAKAGMHNPEAKALEVECAAGSRFTQLYGIAKATLEAKKRGMTVNRFNAPDGTVKLTIGGGKRF